MIRTNEVDLTINIIDSNTKEVLETKSWKKGEADQYDIQQFIPNFNVAGFNVSRTIKETTEMPKEFEDRRICYEEDGHIRDDMIEGWIYGEMAFSLRVISAYMEEVNIFVYNNPERELEQERRIIEHVEFDRTKFWEEYKEHMGKVVERKNNRKGI